MALAMRCRDSVNLGWGPDHDVGVSTRRRILWRVMVLYHEGKVDDVVRKPPPREYKHFLPEELAALSRAEAEHPVRPGRIRRPDGSWGQIAALYNADPKGGGKAGRPSRTANCLKGTWGARRGEL